MTARLLTPFLIAIPAILFGLYQIRLKPFLEVGGVWKDIQDVGGELKETCAYVDGLQGCERKCTFRSLKLELTGDPFSAVVRCLEIRLHEPSGVLFLSCFPPALRPQWFPSMGTFNTSAAGVGYIATYDPSSKRVTKLTANGFESPRGLTPLGMDVVPSTSNPDELTIYVINMRPPLVDLDPDLPPGIRKAKRDEITSARAKKEGADSSIEVFRYVLGGESMQHVATWADEKIVITPNDVAGLPDEKGCWITNTLAHKIGIVRLSLSSILNC